MKFAWAVLALSFLLHAQDGASFDELERQASQALQSNPKQAVTLYRQGLALKPEWAEGWFYLAAGLYELGQYSDSKKAFQRAGELSPKKGAVWAFLGLCEYQLQEYPAAIRDIERGEFLGLPDNRQFVSTVHNRAALIYMRTKDFSAAVDQLRPLAILGDDSSVTIQAFGVAALGLAFSPPDVPLDKRELVELAGRAEWAICANHSGDAAGALQQLLGRFPREPGVHYLDGIYVMAHDPQAARAEFQKELEISPSHVAARLQIAILDLRAGEPDPAVRLSREAVRLQPDNPLAHAVLGRAYMQRNEYESAIPQLQSAERLAPTNPQIHLYLQQSFHRLGKTAEAQKELAEFKRLRSGRDTSGLPDLEGPQGAKK